MTPLALARRLAPLAYETWRAVDGGTAGVPASFDELDEPYRIAIVHAIDALEPGRLFTGTVARELGRRPILTRASVAVGDRVGWDPACEGADAARRDETGEVAGLEPGELPGEIELIRVRWPDGSVTAHTPLERELVVRPRAGA